MRSMLVLRETRRAAGARLVRDRSHWCAGEMRHRRTRSGPRYADGRGQRCGFRHDLRPRRDVRRFRDDGRRRGCRGRFRSRWRPNGDGRGRGTVRAARDRYEFARRDPFARLGTREERHERDEQRERDDVRDQRPAEAEATAAARFSIGRTRDHGMPRAVWVSGIDV